VSGPGAGGFIKKRTPGGSSFLPFVLLVGAGGRARLKYFPFLADKAGTGPGPGKDNSMKRFLALVGASIGSMIGWWLGARVGLATAFLISTLGSGVGFYYGARFAREHLP